MLLLLLLFVVVFLVHEARSMKWLDGPATTKKSHEYKISSRVFKATTTFQFLLF